MLYSLSYCAGTSATPAQRYEVLLCTLRRARMASALSSAASTWPKEPLSPPTVPLYLEPTPHGDSNVGTVVAEAASDTPAAALSTTSPSLSSATTETIEGVRDVRNALEEVSVRPIEDMSREEGTPPSPPSPPRARIAKTEPRVILSSPDTALTNKYYTHTLAPSDPIEEIPDCGHPLHPAHADTYDEFQCPMCLYLDSKPRQSKLDKFIEDKNGVQSWRDCNLDPTVPKSAKDYLRFKRTVRGGSLRHLEDEAVGDHGLDISHRHNKKLLANLEMKLEAWARKEKEWQDTYPEEYAAIHENEKVELRKSSATFALAYYRQAVERGDFIHVEEAAQKDVRKRGREWEIAADPDYPADKRDDAPRFFKTTPEQREFIGASEVPSAEVADAAKTNEASARKRRRIDRKITFNEKVAVREEADVDVLRKMDWSPSSPSSTPHHESPPTPHIESISLKDAPSRRPAFYSWKSNLYSPGEWALPIGTISVNTSGCGKRFEDYEEDMKDLQEEAADWDGMDGIGLGLSVEELESEEESQGLEYDPDDPLLEHMDACNGCDECWRPGFDGICYSEPAYLS
jgi:hypothetical protein